jgi:hypothetical protein
LQAFDEFRIDFEAGSILEKIMPANYVKNLIPHREEKIRKKLLISTNF